MQISTSPAISVPLHRQQQRLLDRLGTGQLRVNGGFVEGDVDGDLVADFRIQVFQKDNLLITADFYL